MLALSERVVSSSSRAHLWRGGVLASSECFLSTDEASTIPTNAAKPVRYALGFPPLFYVRLRHLKWRITKLAGGVWLLALGATARYLSHPIGAGALIPVLWALALYISWSCFASWGAAKRSRVIPYFFKVTGEPRVNRDTFLAGEALARAWPTLEHAALEAGVEPLSAFGLEDEDEVGFLEWHDASRGLRTVAALLVNRDLPEEVRADLVLTEAALRDAREKNVPFRLLLRGDGGVSPAEMDIRRGYF